MFPLTKKKKKNIKSKPLSKKISNHYFPHGKWRNTIKRVHNKNREIIKAKNVIFESKISRKRMCIFLLSKNLAYKLIRDNDNLIIQGQNVKLR